MDEDFYDWLMGAYNNKELNLPEIENACKDRCGARKLWEEFSFGHDEIGNAMEVIANARIKIKCQLERNKRNDTYAPSCNNAPDSVDDDSQSPSKET